MRAIDHIAHIIARYRDDILLFVRSEFDVEPDVWQREALVAFANRDEARLKLCLSAAVGPGKSALLAWCGLWFLLCQGQNGIHPKGYAVSITRPNLRDGLWAELQLWREKSKLLSAFFRQNTERIYCKDHPRTWFIAARSFEKSADKETIGKTLSGLHSRFILYLCDEVGTMHPNILTSAEQGLSTSDMKFGRILAAGNPTDLGGALYHIVKRVPEQWKIISITGDPEDARRSPRISMEWARNQIDLYGRDDPWVRGHILGLFPLSAVNSLLSDEEVLEAMNRTYGVEQFGHAEKRIGVDVAGTGVDFNVLFPRQGLVAYPYVQMRQATSQELATRIITAKKKWGCDQVFLDATGGWGMGTVDALEAAGHGCHAINFSKRMKGTGFFNIRAKMLWDVAQWVKRGGALPKCDLLRREMTEPTYSYRNDELLMEPKDHIIKRLGYSTDRLDALGLTFALPEMENKATILEKVISEGQGRGRDFDPLRSVNKYNK